LEVETRWQTQGIEQVNTAVAEMDKVVQQTAATAEESASASEELSNQAQELFDVVGELTAIVRGSGNGAGNTPAQLGPAPVRGQHALGTGPALNRQPRALATVVHHTGNGNGNGHHNGHRHGKFEVVAAGAAGPRPEEVIPLDEAELKQF